MLFACLFALVVVGEASMPEVPWTPADFTDRWLCRLETEAPKGETASIAYLQRWGQLGQLTFSGTTARIVYIQPARAWVMLSADADAEEYSWEDLLTRWPTPCHFRRWLARQPRT